MSGKYIDETAKMSTKKQRDKSFTQSNINLLSAVLLACLTVLSGPGAATVLTDNYVGGDDHGWNDVIGATGLFDITHADINRSGNTYIIDIYTNFAGRADDGLFSAYTAGNTGIGYGDLMLSRTWSPFGSAPYMDDNHSTGTNWEYGVVLDDRWSSDGGSLSLYAVVGSNADSFLLADDFLTGAVFRNGQEIAVDQTSSSVIALTNTGTWSVHTDGIYDGNDFLRMSFDVSNTGLAGTDNLAMHWGLTCGNDVIEGFVNGPSGGTVPEPSTLGLLSIAGCALLGTRRSRQYLLRRV